MKTIETTGNSEYLSVFSPLSDLFAPLDQDSQDNLAMQLVTSVEERIEDVLPDLRLVRSPGKRRSCHGWNGAQWSWSCGPVATFCQLTESEQDSLRLIVEECAAAAMEEIGTW